MARTTGGPTLMTRFEVEFELESETALALDRDAHLPLEGPGSIELSPTGLIVVGDLVQLSTPMMVVAGVAALLGTFILAVLFQGERYPPAGIATALALLAVGGLAFVRRRRVSRMQRYVVAWAEVGGVLERSLDGRWQIPLKKPVGTLNLRVREPAAGFHDAMAAAEELGVVRVTFAERVVASASMR